MTIEQTFREKYKIVKDIHSMRRKGVAIEDVLEVLRELYDIGERRSETYESNGVFYLESVDLSENLGWYFGAGSLGGIPTGLIGCSSKQVWESVRDELRAREMVR